MIAGTKPLQGKTVLVTGASSGLGRHFALVLANAGADIALAARRIDRLKSFATELEAQGVRAFSVALDVVSQSSVRDAVAATSRALGKIDILINNAGTTVTKPVLDQTEEDWDRVLNTNLKGAFLVATEVARNMHQTQTAGVIVNTASVLGLLQAGQVTPYAVSKAGLIQLTKQLALELSRMRIRVNALAPGYIATDLNREFFSSEAGKAMIKRIPQRRLGQLEDLDGALLLLASDASSYMTGSVIVIDGGHSLAGV
jgi:NAD(P)-dependent dehydrogenase (short-subunit alcohol dehydrogenase family)